MTDFTFEEWNAVLASWDQLEMENKVVFGKKAPPAKNLKALLNMLMKNDQYFQQNLKKGLPATSKKYKSLLYHVTKWSKQKPREYETDMGPEDTPTFNSADESMLFDPP